MKVFALVPAVSLVLTAATSFAQTPAAPPRTAAPAGQSAPASRPQAPTPAPARQPDPPPAAAVAPPPPAPVLPFRDGAKIGYISVQAIASQSAAGQAAGVKIKSFQDQRARELDAKQKALEAKRARLDAGGSVLNDATRQQLQAEIERDGRELNRLAEDSDQDLDRMTQQLQQEFMVKLSPVIRKVAQDRKVDYIFTDQSGLVYAADDLNLTADVIKALDSGAAAPAAAAPAAPPPASTARPPASPAAPPAATKP
jgi:Skp family chaperone for outer membrane proteins